MPDDSAAMVRLRVRASAEPVDVGGETRWRPVVTLERVDAWPGDDLVAARFTTKGLTATFATEAEALGYAQTIAATARRHGKRLEPEPTT